MKKRNQNSAEKEVHACHQGISYHCKCRVVESGGQRKNVEEHDHAGGSKDEPHGGKDSPERVQIAQMQQDIAIEAEKNQGS